MSLFADGSDLREFFFETAVELLQRMNEEGLRLEDSPDDVELLRELRRTVHTLKGDSAAAGFEELSTLAHELEDVLNDQVDGAGRRGLADAVLVAVDVFSSMLSSYREGSELPSVTALREHLRAMQEPPAVPPTSPSANADIVADEPAWSEYEQLAIQHALAEGKRVYRISIAIDPNCLMRSAAKQLLRNAVAQFGDVLAVWPGDSVPSDQLTAVTFAIASEQPASLFESKCRVPSVTSGVRVDTLSTPAADASFDSAAEQVTAPNPQKPGPAAAAAEVSSVQAHNAGKLRVDADRIDSVLNLVGELVIGKSMLMQTLSEFERRNPKDPLRARLADTLAFQSRVLSELQKSVMKIRMVPIEQLFRRFPRMLRDLAKTCGKDVSLQITGEDTDLDKSLLEALSEPLSHLVRNCVDHGIEPPQERAAAGKPETGTVRLHAYHHANQMVIECSDDGRGIDRNRLTQKAVANGIISQQDAAHISDDEAMQLIFHPGFSTAEQITEISGRGVGMDVVRAVLDRLKGSITVESTLGAGTTFRIKVPLTLAIIKALMFRAAGRLYAVPLSAVLEIARASELQVHRVDRCEVIDLRDETLPVVRMRRLAPPQPAPVTNKIFLVVVSVEDRKVALIVDQLVGEEELVIKPLDDQYASTDFVSGASILGDGTVVLILHLPEVVRRLGKAPEVVEAITA